MEVTMMRFARAAFLLLLTLAPPVLAEATYEVSGTTQVDEIFASKFERYTLTISNYLGWCSVSINSGAPSSGLTISDSFADGTVVPVHGAPAENIYIWGYWTGTDADQGSHDTNADTLVTMGADRGVGACCPFAATPEATCSF